MKHLVCLILASATLMANTGCRCSSIQLKDLDRDMPKDLAGQYRTGLSWSTGGYQDHGEIFLPLFLYSSESRVFKGPDDDLYALRKSSEAFSLAYYGTEDSRFDQEGRLLKYASSNYWLAGLLFWGSIKERDGLGFRPGTDFHYGTGANILWYCFGYVQAPDGQRTLRFLWIPIPAGGGKVAMKTSASGKQAP